MVKVSQFMVLVFLVVGSRGQRHVGISMYAPLAVSVRSRDNIENSVAYPNMPLP